MRHARDSRRSLHRPTAFPRRECIPRAHAPLTKGTSRCTTGKCNAVNAMEHQDGKDNGDRWRRGRRKGGGGNQNGRDEAWTREADERWSRVKVASIDCVVVCTRVYCPVTTLHSARGRRGGCLSEDESKRETERERVSRKTWETSGKSVTSREPHLGNTSARDASPHLKQHSKLKVKRMNWRVFLSVSYRDRDP